jgi:4-azaleucine resistance transporter AzlC
MDRPKDLIKSAIMVETKNNRSSLKSTAQQFWRGVRDEAPILLGVIPFGMIYGVLALSANLSVPQAQAMSAIVFAGSSQFMAVKMLKDGAPALIILLTGFVINLRHALYSATLAPYIQSLPVRWKALLSYLLTDEAFAVTVLHYQREENPASSHWYFLGAGVALWTSWQVSTAIGIFIGASMPDSWGLDFTLPLTFIALVVPALKDRAAILTAIVASLLALALVGLPYKLGLLCSALIAIAAGMWMEKHS